MTNLIKRSDQISPQEEARKGILSRQYEEAIDSSVINSEFDESYDNFKGNCREKSLDKERFDKATESIKTTCQKFWHTLHNRNIKDREI